MGSRLFQKLPNLLIFIRFFILGILDIPSSSRVLCNFLCTITQELHRITALLSDFSPSKIGKLIWNGGQSSVTDAP